MKLISLNTWGGRAGKDDLIDFFKRNSDVDIFCLQEVWNGGHDQAAKWGYTFPSMFPEIAKVLGNHAAFFRSHWYDWYGLAMFVKGSIKVREEGDVFVFKTREEISNDIVENHARNLQYAALETANGSRTVMNFHGLWNGIGKEDNEDRHAQADNIVEFLKHTSDPHVLSGDFNLMPENESLKKIENTGMKNLIKEFKITSTRSSHYKKPVRFADYALVSKGIKVKDFRVMPDEISDHLPLYLDFE